jgi:hypothetical protein
LSSEHDCLRYWETEMGMEQKSVDVDVVIIADGDVESFKASLTNQKSS